jgi:2-oxoglutarate ferredoxin oxidoreductase subunit alpha
MPTKTEQADLMQALYGRNSESPVVVLAPATPGDCFYVAYEAVRIAVKYMVPVMVLSDGFLANGSEPWLIPDPTTLPPIDVTFRTEQEGFFPYLRDPATLARPWVRPGTPGLEHRIGGLEKQDVTGNISYDPENHDHMVKTRAEKVRRVGQEIPPPRSTGPPTGRRAGGRLGLAPTAPSRRRGARAGRRQSVASIHLRHLNPLPPDLAHPARVPQGARARDQQRPARARAAGRVPRGRGRLQPRSAVCRSRAKKIYDAIIQLGSKK